MTEPMTAPSTDSRRAEILERRARRLARVAAGERVADIRMELAIVRVGEREVGLPAHAVREIVPRPEITPLSCRRPGAGERVGITQTRGELLAVADLARLLGEPAGRPGAVRPMVIAAGRAGALGLLVDAVVGFRQLRDDELAETFWDRDAERAVPIAGITRDLVTILDLDPLLSIDVPAHDFPATVPERGAR